MAAKTKKDNEPEEPTEELESVESEEEAASYETYSEAVVDFLNSVSQLAAPFVNTENISMITVIAVSADGDYSQSHEIFKSPGPEDDSEEVGRLRRIIASSRLLTGMELQKHKARLVAGLKEEISKIENG